MQVQQVIKAAVLKITIGECWAKIYRNRKEIGSDIDAEV